MEKGRSTNLHVVQLARIKERTPGDRTVTPASDEHDRVSSGMTSSIHAGALGGLEPMRDGRQGRGDSVIAGMWERLKGKNEIRITYHVCLAKCGSRIVSAKRF